MVKQTHEHITNGMRQILLNVLVLQESKRRLTMAEITAKAIFLFGVWMPLFIWNLVITYNDIRFWIMTAFIAITGSWRFVRWLRRDDQMKAKRDQEIEAMRIQNAMSELTRRERELEIMERENHIIRQINL